MINQIIWNVIFLILEKFRFNQFWNLASLLFKQTTTFKYSLLLLASATLAEGSSSILDC